MNISAQNKGAVIFGILILIACCVANGSAFADSKYGYNGTNVNIPDNDGWVYSSITISGVPSDAVVSSIDVHFSAIHTYSGDLDIDLNDSGITQNYDLWANEGGSADNPSRTVYEITTFNGLPVNGTWYLYAKDTAGGDTGYIDEWWITVYYTVSTPPDLAVQSVDATNGTYNPGDTIVVDNVIQNVGGSTSLGYRVDFYASTNTSITTSDYNLGYVNRSGLSAGGTHNYATTVTFPSDIPAGNYYIGLIITSIDDSNPYNNIGYDSTTITVIDNTPPTVNALSVTPASLTLGSSFTISYTVADTGGSGLNNVQLWRANIDGSPTDPSWQQIGSAQQLTGNGPVSNSFSDSPNTAGNYWYGVHVVDNAGNWNDERNSHTGGQPGVYGPDQVTVIPPVPDLAVQSVDATNGTYKPGDTIVVDNVIQNVGGSTSLGYRVDFYASTNTSITTSDYNLGYVNRSGLSAGGTHNYATTVTFPSDIPAGNYYIGLIVTASDDSNSSNNTGYDSTTVTVEFPDLVASNLSINETDSTVFGGDSITVYFNIRNQGTAYAISSYQGIMLSSNTNITSSDTELASEFTGPLFAGSDTNETNYNVPIPTGISGRWYLGILVDKNNDVDERSGESNNNTAYIPIDIPNWQESQWVNNEGCYVGGLLNSVPVVVTGNGTLAERQAARDQLNYWNQYVSIFSTTNINAGAGAPNNGINEINTFLSSQEQLDNYGFILGTDVLGMAVIRLDAAFGTFDECRDFISGQGDTFTEIDVIMNSDFWGTWTIDPNDSYNNSLIQATSLHEIGHTLGLHHIFSLPSNDSFSVMNYNSHHDARYFVTRMDANTLRSHHPDRVQSVLDVGIFPFIYGNSKHGQTYASVSPTTVSIGDDIDISNFLIQNIGNQTASNVLITFYLSTDTIISTSDYLLTTMSFPSLPVNTEYDLNFYTILPDGIPVGNYYIGAIVTANGAEDSIGINNKFIIGRPDRTIITVIDNTPPTVNALSVTPASLTLGSSFTISYTVADTGGSGLNNVQLWRANIDGSPTDPSWQQIGSAQQLTGNGPVSSSFSDSPNAAGNYWYGVHVEDNAGNWNDERNSQTGGQPGVYGPDQVIVLSPDTDPPPTPINLTATPSTWTNNTLFTIDWTNPSDSSGIAKVWYKVGAVPSYSGDGIWLSLPQFKPFYAAATSEGGQPIYVWLEDGVGNKDHNNRSSKTLYYDGTAPSAPATSDEGIYSTDTTLVFTSSPSDTGGSGINNCYMQIDTDPNFSSPDFAGWVGADGDYTWTGAVHGNIYYARTYCKDNAGNVGSYGTKNDGVHVDTVNPTASVSTPSGWISGLSFIVTLTESDSGSGIASGDVDISVNGGAYSDYAITTSDFTYTGAHNYNYKFRYQTTDDAGRVSGWAYSSTIYLDNSDPTITTPIDDGTYSQNTTLNFYTSPGDSGSGVNDVYMQIDTDLNFSSPDFAGWVGADGDYTWTGAVHGNTYYAHAYAKDNVGRTSAWSSASDGIIVDIIAPMTTASPPGGTYSTIQSVTLTANETATVYYTTDGSTPTTNSLTYSGPINISTDTTLKFFALDLAGNSETVKSGTYIINIANEPPVANAGSNQNALTGKVVTLDASYSYDPEGELITFQWTFTNVPSGSNVTDASLSDTTSAKPTFTPDLEGTYTLELTVSDGVSTDTDPIAITASVSNVAPNADAGHDQNALTGSIVYLDGSASNSPFPLSYLWSFTSIPAGSGLADKDITGKDQATANFTTDIDGTYDLSLTVDDGELTSQDMVQIIAGTSNVEPNADAGTDITVALGDSAVCDGSSSNDPDDWPQPLTYDWSFVAVPGGSGMTNSNITDANTTTPSFTPDITGTYVLELMVNDSQATDFDNVAVIAIPDMDGDGIPDDEDNCREVSNPDQRDTNSAEDDNLSVAGEQHYGNICDPDFDNDGIVSIFDFNEWRKYAGQTVPDCPEDVDLNGDGFCWIQDFNIWRMYYGSPPGPGIGD